MVTIDKIAWVEICDKRILSTKSYGKDKYYIPGGKSERNETDLETLIREISEELSVNIKVETAKLFGIFQAQAHGHPEGTMVKMTCFTADHNGELKAASEISEIKWLTYSDKDKVSEVDKQIFDYLWQNNLLD